VAGVGIVDLSGIPLILSAPIRPLCPIYVRAFQEYLEALTDEDELPSRRKRQLLLSFAEFQFKLRGGGICAVCRASVRHVLPVEVERQNGTLVNYPCLCTRCIEAEKAVSRKLTLRLGNASIVHVAPGREDTQPPYGSEVPRRKCTLAPASS
jgi:hypothetical protein